MATIKKIKAGLDIFSAHLGEDYPLGGADHDVFYGPAKGDLPEAKLSPEESEVLKEAGWRMVCDGWEIYV